MTPQKVRPSPFETVSSPYNNDSAQDLQIFPASRRPIRQAIPINIQTSDE